MASDEVEHRAIAQQSDALLGESAVVPTDRFGWAAHCALITLILGILVVLLYMLFQINKNM